MFTGFDVKLPEYEVVTPQTKNSFTLRTMMVKDEEKLKTSVMTPGKVTEHLNRCLYDVMVLKPEKIIDYQTFLRNTTMKDRDAILFGVYHITYGEVREYDIRCGDCKKEFPITFQMSDAFSINPYPDDDILEKRVKIDLATLKGVSVYIRQPTLADEESAFKELGTSSIISTDSIINTLAIERFEQDVDVAKEPVKYTAIADKIDAFKNIPPKDKKLILEKYIEEFGKYGIELKIKVHCIYCGHSDVIPIDLVENFFRMVYSS